MNININEGEITTKNECGNCVLCCELLPIIELKKPPSVLCSDCSINKGCNIYNERPNSCKNFDCVFLKTDTDKHLRPDKTGVVFEFITKTLYMGLVDPKKIDMVNNNNNKNIQDYIKKLNNDNISVIISSFTDEPKRFYPANNTTREEMLSVALSEYNKIK